MFRFGFTFLPSASTTGQITPFANSLVLPLIPSPLRLTSLQSASPRQKFQLRSTVDQMEQSQSISSIPQYVEYEDEAQTEAHSNPGAAPLGPQLNTGRTAPSSHTTAPAASGPQQNIGKSTTRKVYKVLKPKRAGTVPSRPVSAAPSSASNPPNMIARPALRTTTSSAAASTRPHSEYYLLANTLKTLLEREAQSAALAEKRHAQLMEVLNCIKDALVQQSAVARKETSELFEKLMNNNTASAGSVCTALKELPFHGTGTNRRNVVYDEETTQKRDVSSY